MKKTLSYIEKLEEQIDNVGLIIDDMLDNSSIYYRDTNKNSSILILGASKYHWDKKDEKNQIKAKSKYLDFYSNFSLITEKATLEHKHKFLKTF